MKTKDEHEYIDSIEQEKTRTNAYVSLANAIIAQACEDYREVLRGQCKYPERTLSDVMRFFESDWYDVLTNFDRRTLVRKMNEEWESGKTLIQEALKVDCPKLRKQYKFKCPLCGGEAEVHVCRFTSDRRKDGIQKYTYKKIISCDCHIPEQTVIKEEIIHGKVRK